MPCGFNTKYVEWKIWIEKFIPYLNDEVILIGHSLGGIFLAKYLSENKFPVRASQLHLVSAPSENNDDESGETEKYVLGDFSLCKSLEGIANQVDKVFLYHSKDDDIVPFNNLEKYKKELPDAKVEIFEDRGHFVVEEFPEIIINIRSY